MKADIVTLVIFVFCVGVLVSALDLGGLMAEDDDSTAPLVLQQSSND